MGGASEKRPPLRAGILSLRHLRNTRRSAVANEDDSGPDGWKAEIINAIAVGFGAPVGAAIGGVDHHGVGVFFFSA